MKEHKMKLSAVVDLHLKRNEARKLNHEEVVEDGSVLLHLPTLVSK